MHNLNSSDSITNCGYIVYRVNNMKILMLMLEQMMQRAK